ncbi:hypothetical protein [Gulosibacter bifidus]|uniref:DNA helicase n=1 Tax=Gulosibacter bifidus TaxID=272239 RepID=A0ABW5RK68_9MICO|nr:hypothetical protein [Gulosibacter bifidus]
MALSRKNKRKLNRLRRDADRLWSEQQVVFDKARELVGRAGGTAKTYADSEITPVVRKRVDNDIRPAFERGVESGRRALASAEQTLQKNVLPAVAQVGGNVTGAVRELLDSEQVKNVQNKAEQFSKQAAANLERVQAQVAKQKPVKKKKSGPGVGGWFLIGAGVAAISAVGYALWQTFRADDDLWIADEELDAPVAKVVTNN